MISSTPGDTKVEEDPIVLGKVNKSILFMQQSHKLPYCYSNFPFYDRALARVCKNIKDIDGHLTFVDVGANIGDTVALIAENVEGTFLCIEGDSKYVFLLKKNIEKIKGSHVVVEESYCSDVNDKHIGNILVERVGGTTKLIPQDKIDSATSIQFKTLDAIIKIRPTFKNANVLKIDTDGFEINVLKGSQDFVRDAKPVVFLEYSPDLYIKNHQDPLFILDFLARNGYDRAFCYDNFGRPFSIINSNDKKAASELINAIDDKKIYYFDILALHKSKERKYYSVIESELLSCFTIAKNKLDKLKVSLDVVTNEASSAKEKLGAMGQELDSVKIQLAETKKARETTRLLLDSTRSELAQARTNLENTMAQLESTRSEMNASRTELEKVYDSRTWRMAVALRRIANMAIPHGSLRRKTSAKAWKTLRKPLLKAHPVERSLAAPQRRRKINLQSKKIIFVAHSYHKKTQSIKFILDYLKQYFDLKIIYDNSWRGEPFADLSAIKQDHLGVIFLQNIPPPNTLNKIPNDNLLYFPMYDAVAGHDKSWWEQYKNLKIINFSQTLHRKLQDWGLQSTSLQYFPKPTQFIPGSSDEAFFWQRITRINVNTIAKLFGNMDLKLRIHKAIDPNQQFVSPTKEQEKKFRITYSDWYKDKNGMHNLVKQSGIYVAPREYEGIGLSFLEAMAMGKAVIAVNNPTMNEYIDHGETGYLFDLTRPEKIDLSNIQQVQKNAYEFMRAGHEKWEKEKYKIIDFIRER